MCPQGVCGFSLISMRFQILVRRSSVKKHESEAQLDVSRQASKSVSSFRSSAMRGEEGNQPGCDSPSDKSVYL